MTRVWFVLRPVCVVAALWLPGGGVLVAERPSAAGGGDPTVALPDDLARVLSDYEAAWVAHDAAALFAEDGFVLLHRMPPVRAARRFASVARGWWAGRWRPERWRLRPRARWATSSAPSRKRRAPRDAGKFTLTLTQDAGGRWLILSDRDTGNSR
jgi:hypothetical protein